MTPAASTPVEGRGGGQGSRVALCPSWLLRCAPGQRTGTLLAAHAIVASFLGATVVKAHGLHILGWLAVAALVLGLFAAACILSPWRMKFAVDARELHSELYEQALAESEEDTLGWLAAAGYGYQDLRETNAGRVRVTSMLSGLLGSLDGAPDTPVAGGAGGQDETRGSQAPSTGSDQAAVYGNWHRGRPGWRIVPTGSSSGRQEDLVRHLTTSHPKDRGNRAAG
jgi:hypothetical protein